MGTTSQKAAVREYFDRDATGYRDAYASAASGARGEILRERRRLVLDLVQRPLRRVLDAGCGPGPFLRSLIEEGGECFAFDHSEAMVAASRENLTGHPNGELVHHGVADVEALPFRAGSFGTVLCIGVLQYLGAPGVALAEVARVTRPGGQVIVSFPDRRSPLNVMHRSVVSVARTGRRVLGRLGVAPQPGALRLTFREDVPNRACATGEIEAWAAAVGLHVDRLIHHGVHFPFWLPLPASVLRAWDRLANRAFAAGRLQGWGREAIMRLVRS